MNREAGQPSPAFATSGTPSTTATRRLVVVPWLEGGGGQAALRELLLSLGETARRQLDVLVIFEGNRDYGPIEEAAGRIRFLDYPRTPRGSLQAALRLVPIVQSYPLVYSLMRASHATLGLSLLRIPRRRRPRFVASIHSLPSFDRHGARGRLEDVFVRQLLRRCEVVTTPSARAKQEIEKYYRVNPDRAIYEHNLHTLDPRPTVVQPSPGDRPVRLLFAGRLVPQKGLDRIRDLLADAEHPVELLLAGVGEERQHLQNMVHDLAPQHSVTFLGRRTDIVDLLDSVDAAFMPSRHELSPVFLWEAWARGRAMICSDLPIFRDLAEVGPLLIFSDAQEFIGALDQLRSPEFLTWARDAGTKACASSSSGSILHDFLASETTQP